MNFKSAVQAWLKLGSKHDGLLGSFRKRIREIRAGLSFAVKRLAAGIIQIVFLISAHIRKEIEVSF